MSETDNPQIWNAEAVQPMLLDVPPDVTLIPPAAPRQGIHDGSRADPDGSKARAILRMRAMGVPVRDVCAELEVSATYVVTVTSQNEESMSLLRAQRLSAALVREQMIAERIDEVLPSAKAKELPGLALANKAIIDSAGGSAPARLVVTIEGQERDELNLARMGFGAGKISATPAPGVVDVETVQSAGIHQGLAALEDSEAAVFGGMPLENQELSVLPQYSPQDSGSVDLLATRGGRGSASLDLQPDT